MTPRETDETPDTPWRIEPSSSGPCWLAVMTAKNWLVREFKDTSVDADYWPRIVAAINAEPLWRENIRYCIECATDLGHFSALDNAQAKLARAEARIHELEALPPRSPEGETPCADCQFVEAESARLRQENRELKTLAKVGLWHDDCRLNRRQAAEVIEKMCVVEGKLADTITELRQSLERLEGEKAAADTEIKRLEKVVAEFIVADVQRSSDAMLNGDDELRKTMFFVDTQRMKAIKERDEARQMARKFAVQVSHSTDEARLIASWPVPSA